MASVPSKLLSLRNLVWFTAWVISLFGVLQIQALENRWGHSICGAWGCGPPLAALVAYHGFWFLLILPLAVLLSHQLHPGNSRRVGLVVFAIATAAIALIVIVDAIDFWQYPTGRNYLVQRCLFRLATYVDFPFIQLALSGLVLWRCGARKVSQSDSAPAADPL